MSEDIERLDAVHWTAFVAASGDAGRAWVARYHEDWSLRVRDDSHQALLLARRRRLDDAEALLRDVDRRIAVIGSATHGLVQRRYYLGTLGFILYARRRFAEADEASSGAAECVRRALSVDRFLMPLAHHCTEFRYQRARIARNRRRWAEMEALLHEVREILLDRMPYCVLDGGEPVFVHDVRAFYRGLPGLPDTLRGALDRIGDTDRLAVFHRFTRALYASPGWVVEAG